MLSDDVDAATVAFEVGYESASQFNREYSRLFGQPPVRDVRNLRSPGAPAFEAAATTRPDTLTSAVAVVVRFRSRHGIQRFFHPSPDVVDGKPTIARESGRAGSN